MANTSAATNANTNPAISTVFSEYRSINIPEGMDITPYATKKENGKKPAIPILRSKLSMISGTNGPRMLVRKEITEKIKKIRGNNDQVGLHNVIIYSYLAFRSKIAGLSSMFNVFSE